MMIDLVGLGSCSANISMDPTDLVSSEEILAADFVDLG